MTRQEALNKFFNVVLKGESGSYDDHNYYAPSLKSYLKNSQRYNQKYGALNKDLSAYTIKEIKNFQAQSSRSTYGRLFATGRYQIIPVTLIGLTDVTRHPDITGKDWRNNIPQGKTKQQAQEEAQIEADKLVYNVQLQDKLGYYLMLDNPNTKPYITAQNDDNTANLEKAALGMSQIWASIGVPYDITVTCYKYVNGVKTAYRTTRKKNQSYYCNDNASIKTETVQAALKDLRKDLNAASPQDVIQIDKKGNLFFLVLLAVSYYIYKKSK